MTLAKSHEFYSDGTPSPYVNIICKDYATNLCFDTCKFRSIGCAGEHKKGTEEGEKEK